MIGLDTNIVSIAVPVIGRDLSAGISLLGWVITAYVVATAALLLQLGKVGDRYGRKRIYLIGFVLFGVASALCGASFSIYQLIAFRFFQGCAGAMLGANAAPLIFDSFPSTQRGTAIGVNAIAYSIGAIAGPAAGGFIVFIDWRLIFYINVPVAAIAVLIGAKKIPKSKPVSAAPNAKSPLNIVNSLLLGLAVAFVLIWLTFFDIRYALIALIPAVALIILEIKSSNPLFDRLLVANRGFVYSIIGLTFLQTAVLGVPFALAFYYQILLRYTPIVTGMLIVPLAVASVITSPIAGALFDKIRFPAIITIIGALACGVSEVILGYAINARWTPIEISIVLVGVGAGNGLVWAPMISSIFKFVKPDIRGIASGATYTLVNIAFASSIAIVIAVAASFLPTTTAANIFFGNAGNLSQTQEVLFQQGLARSLFSLGIIDFIALPIIALVFIEQRKHF